MGKMELEKLPTIHIATHNGPFHADDVVACALAKRYLTAMGFHVEITRTRNQKEIDQCEIAIDVGGQSDPTNLRFDHHQDRKSRTASAGKIFEFFSGSIGKEFPELEETIRSIDQTDLHGTPNRISSIISSFNPTWEENPNSVDMRFEQALEITRKALNQISVGTPKYMRTSPAKGESLSEFILSNDGMQKQSKPTKSMDLLTAMENLQETKKRKYAQKASQTKGLIILLQTIERSKDHEIVKIPNPALPFRELFSQSFIEKQDPGTNLLLDEIKYIHFKINNNDFGAVAVPDPHEPHLQKFPFPEEWRGKRGQELIEAINQSLEYPAVEIPESSNPNAYFCHPGGFYLATGDKDTMDTLMAPHVLQSIADHKEKIRAANERMQQRKPKSLADKIQCALGIGKLKSPTQVSIEITEAATQLATTNPTGPIPALLQSARNLLIKKILSPQELNSEKRSLSKYEKNPSI